MRDELIRVSGIQKNTRSDGRKQAKTLNLLIICFVMIF